MATAGPDIARFEARAMGSPLRLTLAGPARLHEAHRWWAAVVEEFEAAESAMSRFRDGSELTGINRTAGAGTVSRPSRRLRQALTAADRANRITDGRFDPRVLVDLERLGYRGSALPDTVMRRPGSPGVAGLADPDRIIRHFDRDGLTLDRPIDLGGIGKGLTLRWAAAILDRMDEPDYLLEAGGDLVTRGRSPDGGPWQIAIEDPAGGEVPLAVLGATDLAVATSSTRVNRWTVNFRPVHHLLDPRTGEPAAGGLVSVTVAAVDPAWAEVWSKVLFLGGSDVIATEARGRGLAVWWVADDATLAMTASARALTGWVAAEAMMQAG